jgi:hypothetical protein
VEVWSKSCEFTRLPRLHGDATISGARNPIPIGPERASLFTTPCRSSSAAYVYSKLASIPFETRPVSGRFGLVLIKGDVELPSDVLGLVYEPMEQNEGWKMRLARELKAAGFC